MKKPVGALVDIIWMLKMSSFGLYEIIPGFIAGLVAAVIFTFFSNAKTKELAELYDKAVAYKE